jgi:hypothetical protein
MVMMGCTKRSIRIDTLAAVGAHPGTAALAVTWVEVHIQDADMAAVGFKYFESPARRMVFGNIRPFNELQPQSFSQIMKIPDLTVFSSNTGGSLLRRCHKVLS